MRMRGPVAVILAVAFVSAAGAVLCRLAGWPVAGRELLVAAMISLLAGELAHLPLLLVGQDDVSTVAQAGLGGTVMQMLVSLGSMLGAWSLGVIHRPVPFVWWMLAFYWTTLAAVVFGVAPLVRRAAAAVRPDGPSSNREGS